MWSRVDIVLIDASEKLIASIFRVEERRKSASEEPERAEHLLLSHPIYRYILYPYLAMAENMLGPPFYSTNRRIYFGFRSVSY
jgi:hypothetical protein